MPLLALPNELLIQIARCLLRCPTCRSHHISQHLSALSRSNHRLHATLAEYLLATASHLHILFWAITNSRKDTVALALARGADPNSPLRTSTVIATSRCIHTTPVELAISMRVHSVDAESHAMKLRTLALLFSAGGTCTVDSLIMPTRYGDLDLLTLCLPHVIVINNTDHHYTLRTLLEIAARCGHVEAVKLVIHAGANVNSTGDHHNTEFYPPLWICWGSPIGVLQVLLDAGADPTWRDHHGVSVVRRMREKSDGVPELEEKIALLVRYGAVDESATVELGRRRWRLAIGREYRGWVPCSRQVPIDWPQEWVLAEMEGGCGSLCY